jgi:hypothetical protein
MKIATLWSNGCAFGWWTNKDAWMQSNSIPVSTTATTNIAAAVTASCSTNCVVEMGSRVHRAVVRGCILDLGGGKYGIWVAHDLKQGVPGGTVVEPIIYDSNTGQFSGSASGDGFHGFTLRNFVIECRTGP